MRRSLGILAVGLFLVALAAPAGAIVNGRLDEGDHPNVGALIADIDPDNDELDVLCSGTLIDADTFLTAAHCTAFLASLDPPVTDVFVTFDTSTNATEEGKVGPGVTLLPGSYVTHPDYAGYAGPGGSSDPHDIAVVELDDDAALAYPGISPASLPALHQFGKARTLRGQRFTAVGYGVHEAVLGGPPSFPFDGDRWNAVSRFRSINGAWLRLSQNRSTGDGGTCFGDSGGPNFLGAGGGETGTIAGITISGDSMCRATNVIYRLDTSSAQDFLAPFLS